MLLELNIKDLAIIDSLSISFGRGLSVFTGETGAGKSIVVDAIDLILGDRASVELIRSSAEEARVEADFDISSITTLKPIFEDSGIPLPADDRLIIKRVIHRSGRNKIYINGSLSTLTTLSEIGRRLIDVYGQSEHQSLVRGEEHIEILDAFGDLPGLRLEMADSYGKWVEVKRNLDELMTSIKKDSEEREFLEFQSEEIGAASLKVGYDESLKSERDRLRNSAALHSASTTAEETLYSGQGSVVERLGVVVKELSDAARFDIELSATAKRIESSAIDLEDAATYLRDYSSALEGGEGGDAVTLDDIESQLSVMEKLKAKHGGATIKELLAKKEDIDTRLGLIVDSEASVKRLSKALTDAYDEAVIIAEALTTARRDKAKEFKAAIENELSELGMKGSIFECYVDTDIDDESQIVKFGEKGADHVSFHISTNVGEEVKPLAKVASGGELSRIMLAVKRLTSIGNVSTLIFDEVDTGVGAPLATVVGRKLKDVSKTHQVFSITHMPQIAIFADTHYFVTKVLTDDERTVTRVRVLEPNERVEQIAIMLGGDDLTETNLKHARELLESAVK
ncbi:MAG: DNA repair protein RecN [Deltaproteobacteria bacterium]|nr:DNA repair protein RecN [Deltaproteobacteria bacterium]